MAVDEKGYHLEDCTMEAATCVHVSHLPGKCHRHHSTQPRRGKYRQRKGKEKPEEWQEKPEASKSAVQDKNKVIRKPATLRCFPRLAGPPAKKQGPFVRLCCYLQWLSVQITREQIDTFSWQGSRGKYRKKKCQQLDTNGNGKT